MVARPRKYADTARSRPLNVVPIAAQRDGLPPPPEHLAQPEAALWVSLVETYTMDDAASLTVLTAALECRARARQCREAIDRDGATVVDPRGIIRPHPLMASEYSRPRGIFGRHEASAPGHCLR